MDVFTSTITGGVFGVIIYFLVCSDEERFVSQISTRITGYAGYFFNLHAIVFLCSTCSNGSLFLMYQYSYVIACFTNMELP